MNPDHAHRDPAYRRARREDRPSAGSVFPGSCLPLMRAPGAALSAISAVNDGSHHV